MVGTEYIINEPSALAAPEIEFSNAFIVIGSPAKNPCGETVVTVIKL